MTTYSDFLDEVPAFMFKVRRHANLLIEQGIWDTITRRDLDKWLGNFHNSEEKLLAGLMLENLIYRSAGQTNALLFSAISRALSHAYYNSPSEVIGGYAFESLLSQKKPMNEFRIVPVIRDVDPPSKSGPSLARLYKREIGLNDSYMIWPWMIEESINAGTKVFVFIDDVVASGKQFIKFINKMISKDMVGKAIYIYIPLMAYKGGLELIADKHPYINTVPVETIDDSNNFFTFGNCVKINNIKDLYLEVCKKKVKKKFYEDMALGYENLALSYSFSHATPNSTLPLYWYESDSFYPLLKR